MAAVPPTASQRRAQAAIDSGAALALAMLAWPFPLARAALPPVVHVLSVLVFWQLVQVGYLTLAMTVWGTTAGLSVVGLEVVDPAGAAIPKRRRALWGALSGLLADVRVVAPVRPGARDLPERAADVDVIRMAPRP